jgi:hypothetical protein
LPTEHKIPARQIIWRAFVCWDPHRPFCRGSARVERTSQRNDSGNGRGREQPPVRNVSRRIRGNSYRFGFLGHLSSP